MIGFDLDGVLVPDFDRLPMIGGLDEFYEMTTYIRPIFVPKGEYAIITARHRDYVGYTKRWVRTYLNPRPTRFFHGSTTESPEEYKTRVLNANPDIQEYIESDPGIAGYLRGSVTTGCRIVLFSQYLTATLRG